MDKGVGGGGVAPGPCGASLKSPVMDKGRIMPVDDFHWLGSVL